MRIFGTQGISQWLTGRAAKINERSTVDADSQRQDNQQYEGQQQKKDGQEQPQPTFEEIKNQVDKFAEDAALKASGLQAEIIHNSDLKEAVEGESGGGPGYGPGLRVVVKDKSGNVLRQLTGDEFLKLRDSQAPKSSNVGKLIDRKY